MIDDEDRNAISQGVVLVVALATVILLGALVLGAAIRIFQFASGI